MIEILYKDKDIVGVVKPAGIAVQPGKTGGGSLAGLLSEQLGKKLWLINRLDRNVGGVIFFALNKRSAAFTVTQKRYKAVLCGIPEKNSARLENYIIKNQRLNISKIVNKNSPGSKFAALEYNIEKTAVDSLKYSLADITIETGRHHQIRVQMSNIGCPIYGDKKYNSPVFSQTLALWSYRACVNSVVCEKLPSGGIWDKFI